MANAEQDKTAVDNLVKYIQIPSITRDTDYACAVKFLCELGSSIPLEVTTLELKTNRPAVIMKWPGQYSCSPSIVMHSHMDVLPVIESKWEHPPFSGTIDASCNIFGRGTLDVKTRAIQYIEAVRRLKSEGVQPKKTVVLLFLPEEEAGGDEGMKLFRETPEFKCLQVGLWLDRSGPSGCKGAFLLYHAQKHKCVVKFTITGVEGPDFLNQENTAGDRLAKLIKIIDEFKKGEFKKSPCPDAPEITTLNIVRIKMDQIMGQIPANYMVILDARLPPDTNMDTWRATLKTWCCQVGEGCTMEEKTCEALDIATPLDNRFLAAIKETVCEMGFELQTKINPGTSAARHARNMGIPAFGWSCLNMVNCNLNGQNESVPQEVFLKGIEVYANVLKKLGDMPC